MGSTCVDFGIIAHWNLKVKRIFDFFQKNFQKPLFARKCPFRFCSHIFFLPILFPFLFPFRIKKGAYEKPFFEFWGSFETVFSPFFRESDFLLYKVDKKRPFLWSNFLTTVIFDENLIKKMSKLMLYKLPTLWYNIRRRDFVMGQNTIPPH